jgi:hypothetical protein
MLAFPTFPSLGLQQMLHGMGTKSNTISKIDWAAPLH